MYSWPNCSFNADNNASHYCRLTRALDPPQKMTPSQATDIEKYARDPCTWIFAAQKQLAVAEVLNERVRELRKIHTNCPVAEFSGCLSASYFHAALAIENAAKALSIHRDPSQITSTNLKPRSTKSGHGITASTSSLIPTLSTDELDLLAKLEEYLIWAGKYNVPNIAAPIFDEQLMDKLRTSNGNEFTLARGIVTSLINQCPPCTHPV
jgi:hypothetical protein